MSPLLRLRVLLLFMATALVAAACGGSADSASVISNDGRPQSFEDIEYESPLSDLLGFGFDDSEQAQAEFAELDRQAEQIIAECMLRKGFEYQPMVQGSFETFGQTTEQLPYFSDEWVEKYGFGVTTQRFPQSSVGELVGYEEQEFPDEAEFGNPNQEYMESLSEGERQAYQAALIGEFPDPDEQTGDLPLMFEPSGCEGEAYEQVYDQGPGGAVSDMEFFETFGDPLLEMRERVDADPRVIEYRTEVADCMREAGETWTGNEDVYERFEEQLNELAPQAFTPDGPDPFEAAGLDPLEMSDRELDEFFRELDRIDPDKLPILAALQAEEIALAQTVVGCGGGPLNEEWVLSEIRIEYEQLFVDQNADALAEFATDE